MEQPILLTQYAHGAGCGCKIAPAVLNQMLIGNRSDLSDKRILIGNSSNDDAAVYDLGNGQGLIVTTDFFAPIVNDAYTFGRVAAANAISDVYAMGGKPITAIAILGWPVDKLPPELAAKVMEGARETCKHAGIVISGGHSIDAPEPFFGLSVNGLADIAHLKQNNTAQPGDLIYMTKPLGLGILATAHKRGLTKPEDDEVLVKQLTTLNQFGEQLGKLDCVTALTDITGFGLLGHLLEMCDKGRLTANINYAAIPLLEEAKTFAKQFVLPDATYRNWNAFSNRVSIAPTVDAAESFSFLPDPQTNGGLLIAVEPNSVQSLETRVQKNNTLLFRIGQFQNNQGPEVHIQ